MWVFFCGGDCQPENYVLFSAYSFLVHTSVAFTSSDRLLAVWQKAIYFQLRDLVPLGVKSIIIINALQCKNDLHQLCFRSYPYSRCQGVDSCTPECSCSRQSLRTSSNWHGIYKLQRYNSCTHVMLSFKRGDSVLLLLLP